MLCHMAGKLTSTTFEGTWAFERNQPLRWPFAFQIAESINDEHGARVLELKGSFEGVDLTAPGRPDAFTCTIQKNGQIDGKGRSRFGSYAVRGVLAYDGEGYRSRKGHHINNAQPSRDRCQGGRRGGRRLGPMRQCQKWRSCPRTTSSILHQNGPATRSGRRWSTRTRSMRKLEVEPEMLAYGDEELPLTVQTSACVRAGVAATVSATPSTGTTRWSTAGALSARVMKDCDVATCFAPLCGTRSALGDRLSSHAEAVDVPVTVKHGSA